MSKFFNELKSYQSIPRELVFDDTLSDRARFVYVFMSCKPEGWDLDDWVISKFNESELNELKNSFTKAQDLIKENIFL